SWLRRGVGGARPLRYGRRQRRSGAPRAGPLPVDRLSVLLGHPAPDAVGLLDRERVLTALLDDRALLADGLGPGVPASTRRTALALGMEERVGVGGAAQALELPLPESGDGHWLVRHGRPPRAGSGLSLSQICTRSVHPWGCADPTEALAR